MKIFGPYIKRVGLIIFAWHLFLSKTPNSPMKFQKRLCMTARKYFQLAKKAARCVTEFSSVQSQFRDVTQGRM